VEFKKESPTKKKIRFLKKKSEFDEKKFPISAYVPG